MEVIILAGGLGTRLQSLIKDTPKPMARIGNTRFLEILMSHLKDQGVSKFIISIGYLGGQIKEYFGTNYKGTKIVYVSESEPLGTGGAMKLALSQVESEFALICNGDTYLEIDLYKLQSHWHKLNVPIIVGCNVDNTFRYGKIIEEDGIITGFLEKSDKTNGLINAGCYLLKKNQLNDFPISVNFSFENDYLPKAIQNNRFSVFKVNGKFIDIGIPDDFKRAEKMLLSI